MKKDLTVSLDSFSGVEKSCLCIENTTKTFLQCPIGKFKLNSAHFQTIFQAIFQNFCTQETSPSARPTLLSTRELWLRVRAVWILAGRTSPRTRPTSLSTRELWPRFSSVWIFAVRTSPSTQPTSLSTRGLWFSARREYIWGHPSSPSLINVPDRTLHTWNKPYC